MRSRMLIRMQKVAFSSLRTCQQAALQRTLLLVDHPCCLQLRALKAKNNSNQTTEVILSKSFNSMLTRNQA